MRECKYISCSGGGTKGVMYLGMYKAFEDHFVLRQGESFQSFLSGIQGFAGTSIGSLFALALYLNLSYADLMEIAQPRMSHMQSLIPQFDISLFFLKYGVDDGSEMQAFIKTVMRVGGVNADATFADLHRLLKRDFVCVATNAHTGRPIYFSTSTTPKVRVHDAVYMSMCVPFLLRPICHESELCVDGSLSDNTPDCFPKAQTLYLCFAGPRSRHWSIDTPMDYFASIFSMSTDRRVFEAPHLVLLSMPTNMLNANSMDLSGSEVEARTRYLCGYYSALAHLYPDFMQTMVGLIQLVYALVIADIRSREMCVDESIACLGSLRDPADDRCT